VSADTDKDFNVIGHGKKPLAIGLILVLALGAGAYVNRVPLVLALAKYRAHSVAVDKDLSQSFEGGDEYIFWPN